MFQEKTLTDYMFQEKTLTDYMFQEKMEEEDLQALKTALTHPYND